MKYPELEKALLAFSVDFVVGGSRTYLDPSKPIVINGKPVKIPDLPSDTTNLRVVERSDLDVTSLLKTSSAGSENLVEVNYIVDSKGRFMRQVGNLTMSLTVITPEKKVVRYCFFCGAQNDIGVKHCTRCGRLQEVGGEQTVACTNPNCGEVLPLRSDVRFCDKCGSLQEGKAAAKTDTKACVKCGASIDKEAVFCSKCGAPQ
jgi:ribosomal protein L40E